jgi:hypothetical protein
VYVLQVMSILQQAYCSPKYLYYLMPGHEKSVREPDGSLRKEVLISSPKEFEQVWRQAVSSLRRAMELLHHPQEFGVVSSEYLPYVSILPAFAALQHWARSLPPNRRLDAQRKIRHWYWSSVFTNRYSGSVESTTARDFMDIKAWIDDDANEPGLIDEFRTRFRTLDLRKETRRGTSIYNGVFNLLVISGARDWMTGNVPQYGDLDDHHIIPKKWGQGHQLGGLIDTILNRAPLTTDTNRNVISDRLPSEYLTELIAANGEQTVRTTLESHFISSAAFDILLRDPFLPSDFDDFIAQRQRTLQDAIEDLFIKERLDLPPRLRELDIEIEEVELQLRRTVRDALGDDSRKLPAHVQQRVEERLQAAVRKNPALDLGYLQTLAGQLEYFDLREIQDTVTNKALWPVFENRFGTKETLAVRFNQLGELRNGIRHSRTVDEVTRKDGEAALPWFRQVLNK